MRPSISNTATFVAAVLLLSSPAFAATYVVPEDRVLVDRSHAIVIGTVIDAHVQVSEQAGIETVTSIRVAEGVKGIATGETIEVIEPGSSYGTMTRVIAGVPTLDVGQRVLLMLRARPDGSWAVMDLALGKFAFAKDVEGRELLVRDDGISGWDSQLRPYEEKRRSATAFLTFVREQVRGHQPVVDYFVPTVALEQGTFGEAPTPQSVTASIAPFTAESYTLGGRRPGFPSNVTYGRGTSAEAGAAGGGNTAINAGMNGWNNISGTDIKLAYNSASIGSDTGLQPTPGDGKNTIQFERDLSWAGVGPFTCNASSYSGVLGLGGFHSTGSHSGPNGESFQTIVEGDVEMNQGVANCTLLFNSGDFNSAMMHEIGHSIGFRHSDQTSGGGACSGNPSLECANTAIMKSFISTGKNAVAQTWDVHAAQAVYPGAVVCTPPSISSQSGDTSITSGNSTTLSVSAAGTAALSYQWYIGASGNTSTPTGPNSNSLLVSPTTTTSYWVRVTGQCAPVADSATITVTVNPAVCTPPSITSHPGNVTITSGNTTTLSVTAAGTSPFSYQWYIGASGNTGTPTGSNSSSLLVSPGATTSYWVRVTGQCAPTVDSNAATVTVNPGTCVPPGISAQPASSTITAGNSAVLTVTATGTSPYSYQWYTGSSGNTTTLIATSNSILVSPTSTASFWVRVTGQCGSPVDSNTATITVNPATCIPPSIITQPQDQTVVAGNTATLSVGHNNSSPTITWYQGAPPNTATPVGIGRVITSGPIAQTTTFYAVLTNNCGTATTRVMTVTVTQSCTAPAITGISATPSAIGAGQSSAVTVVAIGTSLGYQWYVGAPGDTSNPVAGGNTATIGVSPASTTSYWVKVSSGCGAAAVNSTAVIVTLSAASCTSPGIVNVTGTLTVPPGSNATLTVDAFGTDPLKYEWYQGPNGDTSKPVGINSAVFVSAPLFTETQFWVRVGNTCGAADSAAVNIIIKSGRRRVTGH